MSYHFILFTSNKQSVISPSKRRWLRNKKVVRKCGLVAKYMHMLSKQRHKPSNMDSSLVLVNKGSMEEAERLKYSGFQSLTSLAGSEHFPIG